MKKIILFLIQTIFIVLIIYSSYNIYIWYSANKTNKEILNQTQKYVTKDKEKITKIDFNELKKINSDTVGYLKFPYLNIEIPIVKYKNNSYYLSHNYNKEENISGWIFADYNNRFDETDKNIILYGHNTKDGSMFGKLKNLLKKDWQSTEENQIITLITENKTHYYQIFSTYKIEPEEYYIKTIFNKEEDYKEFLQKIKSRTTYNFNIELNGENILTLSTCSEDGSQRVVIHAKEINPN
ncbi:MAG: class B sortase [Bacilli bacterium]|nr:class B sortase [Bacilli bacterium]